MRRQENVGSAKFVHELLQRRVNANIRVQIDDPLEAKLFQQELDRIGLDCGIKLQDVVLEMKVARSGNRQRVCENQLERLVSGIDLSFHLIC